MIGKDFENPWGRKTKKGKTLSMSSIINSGVFPGLQGGPLEHVIASKAIAFNEAMSEEFKEYTKQVVVNARTMAKAFQNANYKVISGGTDNHLMLIDLRSKGITGKVAENALVKADITVNKNLVPFDDQSPFVTSGIRIGVAAVTSRGLNEDDCVKIFEWINQILEDPENESVISQIKSQVNGFMSQFPLYPSIHKLAENLVN